jgi:hypothetical protein
LDKQLTIQFWLIYKLYVWEIEKNKTAENCKTIVLGKKDQGYA